MKIEDNTLTLTLAGPGPDYADVHIWLPQMALEAAQRGEAVISGKTFSNCYFEGPAVLLALAGCDFDGCNMGDASGDARNLMLQPLGPQRVTGTIAFENCKFQNCRFLRVGFTGAPEFLNSLQQALGGPAQ